MRAGFIVSRSYKWGKKFDTLGLTNGRKSLGTDRDCGSSPMTVASRTRCTTVSEATLRRVKDALKVAIGLPKMCRGICLEGGGGVWPQRYRLQGGVSPRRIA